MPVLFSPIRGIGEPVYVTTTTTSKLGSETVVPVSYTHLTLPTKRIV